MFKLKRIPLLSNYPHSSAWRVHPGAILILGSSGDPLSHTKKIKEWKLTTTQKKTNQWLLDNNLKQPFKTRDAALEALKLAHQQKPMPIETMPEGTEGLIFYIQLSISSYSLSS